MNVKLPTATIRSADGGFMTILPCGASAFAQATCAPSDCARADGLGYHGNAVAMHRDHDLTHSLLALWLGLPVSPVMAGVAHGRTLSKGDSDAEEAAVLAIQRFAQQQGVDLLEVARRHAVRDGVPA